MVLQLLGLAILFLGTAMVSFAAQNAGMSVYPVPTSAMDINPNWEVVYWNTSVFGVVGRNVTLECGSLNPDLYIWSFTQPGTDAIKAVAYNLGKGPRVLKLAKTLGQMSIYPNSATVDIEQLLLAAHGLFTCQAFYDILEEPKVHYYYVHLSVRVPVSKPVLLLTGMPVEGSALSLHCSVENGTGPFRYTWQHEIPNGSVINTTGSFSIIHVSEVTRNYTGWHICVVSNPVNTETSDPIWLDILFGPDDPQIDVTPNTVTDRGYSALESENVSLMCHTQSNPSSQFFWFYNNSQLYSGRQLLINNILRAHSGNYTCWAHNTVLNTSSDKTIQLTIYYPPDGSPSCSVEPALNHSSLQLICSWPGGFPSPALRWKDGFTQNQSKTIQQSNTVSGTIVSLPPKGLVSNNSLFTCVGSHPALKQMPECSTRTYLPAGELECFAYVTNNKQYLLMSCSWDGGAPRALVWWEEPEDQGTGGEESSNILVVRYGFAKSEKPYTCFAHHPLLTQPKKCSVTLDAVSKPDFFVADPPVEGSTIRMGCKVKNGTKPIQHMWQRRTDTGNFTTFSESSSSIVNLTSINRNHTGWYRCVAGNAVSTEVSDPFWLDVLFGPDDPQIDFTPKIMTRRPYSPLETEDVSLSCGAQSNPASQYIWVFNKSQIHSGPHLTINGILRVHAGDYTCSARNTLLSTSSNKTISLTVYYPPDDSPSCSVEPGLNHSTLQLICSWPGGFPSPVLRWKEDFSQNQSKTTQLTSLANGSIILMPPRGMTPNNSNFTCVGSHPALKQMTECSAHTYLPAGELLCFANVTNNRQYLMLSCFWNGGAPKALVWWEGPGDQRKTGEESSNVLIVRYEAANFGKPFNCYVQHPLLLQPKTCSITLVPVSKPRLLVTEFPQEDSPMWMRCSVESGTGPIQYTLQRGTPTGTFSTFSEGDGMVTVNKVNRSFTGWYRCVASNSISSETSDPLKVDIIFGPNDPQIDVSPNTRTDRGYTALEREAVSMLCQAQSSPASEYVWFYNNSQISIGTALTINKVLRGNTGDYTCLAQNPHLKARSKKVISLIVYYPPDGSPSCTLEPALNHSALWLICSWPGGFPSPALYWKEYILQDQSLMLEQRNPLNESTILLTPRGLISNNSLFTCVGSHSALKQVSECGIRTYLPAAEPVCFAYVTSNKQYLMLSCSWDGGVPKALVWWEGPEGQIKAGQENSNILVLRYGTARSGKPYTCYAQHPLLLQPKSCRLTLEAPVLLTQRRVVSVYEGSDVQLTCNLRMNYLPANEITWFNNRGSDIHDTSKYMLLQTPGWANLTVRDTDETQDSGEYRCSTSNAVGGAEINVTLVVKKYPMPPNVTLTRVLYNSQQRQQVDAEWHVESEEDKSWTGFFLEHRWVSERPGRKGGSNGSQEQVEERVVSKDWYPIIIQDPSVRSHTVHGLIPTVTYQFRITCINHRTIGHPSAAKTPVESRPNMYPAVIGAAVGGMLIAAILTAVLLLYIIRNRNNNPRLHDMLFGSQHSQSRENINFPEDEVAGGPEGGAEERN